VSLFAFCLFCVFGLILFCWKGFYGAYNHIKVKTPTCSYCRTPEQYDRHVVMGQTGYAKPAETCAYDRLDKSTTNISTSGTAEMVPAKRSKTKLAQHQNSAIYRLQIGTGKIIKGWNGTGQRVIQDMMHSAQQLSQTYIPL